jgi:hypothetical protein
VNRVGIRIYLSVGGEEEPATQFELERFTPVRDDDGRPGIDVDACNTGGRAIDLEASLSLTDGPGGTSAGPFESSGGALTLGPGECGPVRVRAPADLPVGPWKARATLRSGRFSETAEATIKFPGVGAQQGDPVRPERVTDSGWGWLLILLALLLLLLALALLLWWLWRRRQRRQAEPRES